MMKPICSTFGKLSSGEEIASIRFSDGISVAVEFINYGAAIRSLYVLDKRGNPVDICLGYDTIQEYEQSNCCFGATMGRCVDRIAGAKIFLSGKEHQLSENRKGFHIHGGFCGFHKRVWEYELQDDAVVFFITSPSGDEGYPGQLTATVRYSFPSPGVLEIAYDAVSDKKTVINLTNHSYFNLDGHASGDVLRERLLIQAKEAAETDENNIPLGSVINIAGTPLDFSTPKALGVDIGEDYFPVQKVGGYDHTFFLEEKDRSAQLHSEKTGIIMSIKTDFPALHIYTANFLHKQRGKNGAEYGPYHGICLETEYVPNGMNLPCFQPQPIFDAGQHFRHKTQLCFNTE